MNPGSVRGRSWCVGRWSPSTKRPTPGETTVRRTFCWRLPAQPLWGQAGGRGFFGTCAKWSPVGVKYNSSYAATISMVSATERDWRVHVVDLIADPGYVIVRLSAFTLWQIFRTNQRLWDKSASSTTQRYCKLWRGSEASIAPWSWSTLETSWSSRSSCVVKTCLTWWSMSCSTVWSRSVTFAQGSASSWTSWNAEADFCLDRLYLCVAARQDVVDDAVFSPEVRLDGGASSSSLHLVPRTATARMRSSPVFVAARGVSELRKDMSQLQILDVVSVFTKTSSYATCLPSPNTSAFTIDFLCLLTLLIVSRISCSFTDQHEDPNFANPLCKVAILLANVLNFSKNDTQSGNQSSKSRETSHAGRRPTTLSTWVPHSLCDPRSRTAPTVPPRSYESLCTGWTQSAREWWFPCSYGLGRRLRTSRLLHQDGDSPENALNRHTNIFFAAKHPRQHTFHRCDPRVTLEAVSKTRMNTSVSSIVIFGCSCVHPPGPGPPSNGLQTFQENWLVQRDWNARTSGTIFITTSWGRLSCIVRKVVPYCFTSKLLRTPFFLVSPSSTMILGLHLRRNLLCQKSPIRLTGAPSHSTPCGPW